MKTYPTDEWTEMCKRIFPHMTEKQREQLWRECHKTEPKKNYYERYSNKTRFA